jgi:hypothetical protein
MKQTPILFSTPMVQAILEGRKTQTRRVVKHELDNRGVRSTNNIFEDWHGKEVKCPCGQVGDVLWVREAYAPHYFDDFSHGYKANWNDTAAEYVNQPKWKPSIHMPKEACRIFLKITDIRVERLQDISNSDIRAEGAAEFGCTSHRLNFQSLWQSINGQQSWEANPWVWVIEFDRIAYRNT